MKTFVKLPEGFGKLSSLQKLYLNSCAKLKELSGDVLFVIARKIEPEQLRKPRGRMDGYDCQEQVIEIDGHYRKMEADRVMILLSVVLS